MNNTANSNAVPSQWRHSLCVAMLLSYAEIAAYLVVLGVRKLTRRAE